MYKVSSSVALSFPLSAVVVSERCIGRLRYICSEKKQWKQWPSKNRGALKPLSLVAITLIPASHFEFTL
jgi:hypothetical protein